MTHGSIIDDDRSTCELAYLWQGIPISKDAGQELVLLLALQKLRGKCLCWLQEREVANGRFHVQEVLVERGTSWTRDEVIL